MPTYPNIARHVPESRADFRARAVHLARTVAEASLVADPGVLAVLEHLDRTMAESVGDRLPIDASPDGPLAFANMDAHS